MGFIHKCLCDKRSIVLVKRTKPEHIWLVWSVLVEQNHLYIKIKRKYIRKPKFWLDSSVTSKLLTDSFLSPIFFFKKTFKKPLENKKNTKKKNVKSFSCIIQLCGEYGIHAFPPNIYIHASISISCFCYLLSIQKVSQKKNMALQTPIRLPTTKLPSVSSLSPAGGSNAGLRGPANVLAMKSSFYLSPSLQLLLPRYQPSTAPKFAMRAASKQAYICRDCG